jgi:energy-coupling factor transporter ATP-binding protein EcfA2
MRRFRTSATVSGAGASADISGRGLLIGWAAAQDDWLRELVAFVLERNGELEPEIIQSAFEHMLIEKRLASGERVVGPTLVEHAASQGTDPVLALVSIDGVKNVNALADGQDISFNSKMTVLFGRNGSGKTGYARILKRLSSVRSEQKILPDITRSTPTTEPPESRVRYKLAGAESALDWRGAAGVPPFTRIDVFDGQDAPIYVDGELTYVYTPTEVALFRHVAKGIEDVRSKLETAKRERNPGTNVFAGHFKRTIPFYSLIDTLGATTNLAQLVDLAASGDDDRAALEGLRETVDALSGQAVQAQLRSAQSDLALCEQALAVVESVKAVDLGQYDEALARVKAAEERKVNATRGAFADESLPGFMTAEWRAFVTAGEQYTSALKDHAYPEHGEPCLYCRQPLTEAAVALLTKYRAFCNGEHQKAAARERAILDGIGRPLAELDLGSLDAALRVGDEQRGPSGEVPLHVRDARLALQLGREFQRKLAAGEGVGTTEIRTDTQQAIERLGTHRATFVGRAVALKGKADEREKALAEATAKRDLLEARIALAGLLPAIETFVERSRWTSVADGVLQKFKTLGKTLTEASKQASERLINHDFEKHFRDECRWLNAPHVNLDFKGHKGAAARKKQLRPEYKLTESLSEGEQKVIALADFLAEARLRTTNAPVVFDDPVTSLDYERIREVASRLAALAEDRQVVVFTHNIWFAVELLERFRDRRGDCAYYDVRAVDGRRGIVSGGTHPRSDSWNDLRKRLNTTLLEARKAAGETQDALVFRGYSILRALCEVAVESELFHGVVRRYEPNLRLTVLPELKPIALKAACDVIHPAYENACRYIEAHSQPLEHLSIVRTVDELEKDFKAVNAAVDEYRAAAA